MSTFFFAILMGVAWMGLTAEIEWGSFAVGTVIGLTVWRIEGARARRPFGPVRALRLTWLGLRFLAVFLWELVVASVEQLRIVLAPRIDVRPGWARFSTELETPAMRALLGLVVSLTPGSLIYDESISEDGVCHLAIHVLDLRDEQRLLDRIHTRFEAPLRAMETL
ncbi:MAG: Na+/H+ antiporter subunit E [Deltaproteobacteria bacterium]|nr:Na+/H+ antiporter subunit E [Deltaproteobacteria bacterium]